MKLPILSRKWMLWLKLIRVGKMDPICPRPISLRQHQADANMSVSGATVIDIFGATIFFKFRCTNIHSFRIQPSLSSGFLSSDTVIHMLIVHYDDVIMTILASQITSLTVVYSIVYSGVDERKHQSSASLAFVRGIHRDRWIPRTKGQ